MYGGEARIPGHAPHFTDGSMDPECRTGFGVYIPNVQIAQGRRLPVGVSILTAEVTTVVWAIWVEDVEPRWSYVLGLSWWSIQEGRSITRPELAFHGCLNISENLCVHRFPTFLLSIHLRRHLLRVICIWPLVFPEHQIQALLVLDWGVISQLGVVVELFYFDEARRMNKV